MVGEGEAKLMGGNEDLGRILSQMGRAGLEAGFVSIY